MMGFRRRNRHSLSGKLLLLFIVFAVLLLLLVGGSMRHAFRAHFDTTIQPHLLQYLSYVEQDLGTPPSRKRAKQLSQELNMEILIQDQQGDWSSHGRQLELDKLQIKHRHRIGETNFAMVEVEDDDNYLMVEKNDTRLLFGIPRQERELTPRAHFPLLVLLLVLILLYHATRRLFAPLQTIRAGVQRFGAGELEHRIHVERRDELGELAGSFNAMADDIQQMLEAKRQLLLAISHELRSPLTRTKVATELLDDAEQRAVLHRDLDEMEKLLEELLETERLSTPHRVLNRATHDLQIIITQVLEDFYGERDIRFITPQQECILSVDAARIKLMLKNLLDNALRHSPAGQGVSVELEKIPSGFEIRVCDEGEGIDPQHLAHLTEPFYRVDPARQRETGGYGLGLYLCRMIAEAHGGSLSIDSQRRQGTCIRVGLPDCQK